MHKLGDATGVVIDAVASFVADLPEEQFAALADAIVDADRVFVHGAGRSGLIAEAFAMRLVHLGLEAHVVGAATTPAIGDEDLLICLSGSGTTQSVLTVATTATELGASVYCLTRRPDSALATLADGCVELPGADDSRADVAGKPDGHSHPPLGTMFEDAALLVLDGFVVELMDRLDESEASMADRHANLE